MYEELAKLILDYSRYGLHADYAFYDKLIKIIVTHCELDDVFKELIIIGTTNDPNPKYSKYTTGVGSLFGNALYDTIDDNLVIYHRFMSYSASMTTDDAKLKGYDKYVFYNLLVARVLLHEAQHMMQKKMKMYGKGLESDFLRFFDDDSVDTIQAYDYSIDERLADIRSNAAIVSLLDMLHIKNPFIYDFFNKELNNSFLAGYHFEDEEEHVVEDENATFVSPTWKFAQIKGANMEELEKLALRAEGNDRIMFGLPISLEEFKEMKASMGDGPTFGN